MNIIDWFDIGKVSAERDDNLSHYFFDNGILASVIASPSSFLVLGRKGAGKTAVFKHLTQNPAKYIAREDILVPLSLEDYNWRVHKLLESREAAESLAFKQSWRFVLLVEAVRALAKRLEETSKSIPKPISGAVKLLEKLFAHPLPGIVQIIGRKLLSLSKLKLPSGGLDLEDGGLDSVEVSAGEVEFSEVEGDGSLQSALSQNIGRIISFLERALDDSKLQGKAFICFDRVDEAWDSVSVGLSKKVIAGLVGAADAITQKFKGLIRPIVFLREDIFATLPLNDSNKLREDCGSLLKWEKEGLEKLLLKRINYFANNNDLAAISSINDLFDKKEMRQRLPPFGYLLRRSMMRPRDLISFLHRIIESMREKMNDPFQTDYSPGESLEVEAIYDAEPGYSDWLKEEIIDEWGVQYPQIRDQLNAIQNIGSTNISSEQLKTGLGQPSPIKDAEFIDALRFLFENSILGFKSGSSTIWKYKCFHPSQGFVETGEYKIHDGLVRCLNLKEPRSSAEAEVSQ